MHRPYVEHRRTRAYMLLGFCVFKRAYRGILFYIATYCLMNLGASWWSLRWPIGATANETIEAFKVSDPLAVLAI